MTRARGFVQCQAEPLDRAVVTQKDRQTDGSGWWAWWRRASPARSLCSPPVSLPQPVAGPFSAAQKGD